MMLGALCLGLVAPVPAHDGFPNASDALGPRLERAHQHHRAPARPHRTSTPIESLRRWNRIAIDASGIDHTPPDAEESRVFGEQLGPGRSGRAMAIVHIAIFDALNAAVGGYRGYTGLRHVDTDPSLRATIAQAAHDTLVALFPSQAASFDAALDRDLASVRDLRARREGVRLGRRAAAAILAQRASDGSQHAELRMDSDYVPNAAPGIWRQDPISQIPLAVGARWGEVTPFVLASPDQFRVPPPPDMTSPEYAAAYEEVKALGGDGIVTPTQRTDEQTEIGIYWAYDGTPSLCAPPRLYNQIAVQIADQMGSDLMQTARLLALVNTAMADAGIAIWESKYHYAFWRPVTGIREAEPGTGPSGLGDGNPDTVGDPTFSPLGAPASNFQGPNFTPPFPAYPSGHAGFGGALFQTLRRFYRKDRVAFTFVSDEFNGTTLDNRGIVRPLIPRRFTSFSEAEEENGQSRIYLGIHWSFDKTEGIVQGRNVADYVFEHAFRPVRRRAHER
jgi:hypothetical protein